MICQHSDHQRWRQDANYGGSVETTHYIGGLLQLVSRSGGSPLEYRHLIPAGSSAAIFVRRSDGTSSMVPSAVYSLIAGLQQGLEITPSVEHADD